MSSIPATPSHPQMISPRERIQEELESGISSGAIRADDQTALETALDAIDEAMRQSRPSEGSGRPASPDEMSRKISDLVDEQAAAGTLTTDQADELKKLFTAAPQEGAGGPGGPGGPPPPPPEGEPSSETSSSSSTDLMKLLEDFLKQLQETKSTSTAYGTDGASSTADVTALVLDTTV